MLAKINNCFICSTIQKRKTAMSYSLTILIVAFGGALGSIARFQITNGFNSLLGNQFPYAVLTVNVVGSCIMGALIAAINSSILISPYWRPLIAVGFLGALTTFSSFSMDTLTLFIQGEWVKAALNIVLNVVLCLLAVTLGYILLNKAQ